MAVTDAEPPVLHQIMVSRRVGGAALMAIGIAEAAVRRRWPNVTWVPGPGPAADALEARALPFRTIPIDPVHRGRVPQLMTSARLFAALARTRRAVVHVHDSWMWGLVRPALRRTPARTVVHVNLQLDETEMAWLLAQPPDHVITCARYLAQEIQAAVRARGLHTQVTAIPNAIDDGRFQERDQARARNLLNIGPPGAFVMLMLANLSPHKGQATAIRTVRALRDGGVEAECWLAGEDRSEGQAYLAELRGLASDLGVAESVRFLGFRSDGPTLLAAADAVVLPSTHEGLPFAILEAQAAGVPVVASDIPGIREVVSDGETGFIVAADDPTGYAARLTALRRDPGIRARLASAARAHVQHEHAWSTFENRTFSLYQTLV